MAWTNPRDWSTNEVVTSSIMNQHVRDNLNAVARAGSATGLAPTTSAAEITSTANEVSMRVGGTTAAGNTDGWLIPAGLIGTDRLITLKAAGDWLYNANQSLRIRIYLRDGVGGNTLLWDDTAGGSAGVTANRGPWEMEVNVAALASASSQLMWGHLLMRKNSSLPTSGIGDFPDFDTGGAYTNGAVFADDAASAVDMSAARYLDVTVTWGASSASLAWRLKYATLVAL